MEGYRLTRRLPAVRRIALGLLVPALASLGHEARAESAAQQARTVTVRITANAVTVSPSTVRAGKTTFRVTNAASVPYELDIDGPGEDGELDNIAPGDTSTLTMTLRNGTYRIESSPETEPDRENQATLTVQG